MIYLIDLEAQYKTRKDIPYFELLKTNEWITKREKILERDNHRCTNCKAQATIKYLDAETGKFIYYYFEDDVFTHFKDENEEMHAGFIPSTKEVSREYVLHAHHCYYVLGKLPWEYDDEALITLCNWCHNEYHRKNRIPIYKPDEFETDLSFIATCSRCGGSGYLLEYSHVQNGICFGCWGCGYRADEYTAKAIQQL